jgi:hypothetical protein
MTTPHKATPDQWAKVEIDAKLGSSDSSCILELRDKIDNKPSNNKDKSVIEPHSEEWERLANNLARSYFHIIVCNDCSYPVLEGYCCGHCGSDNPEGYT